MFFEIFRWWLVIQALGLLALPLTNFLFRFLPDRGYAFSKAFGLLLTGYGAWLIAMLGLAPFGAALLAAVALAMGAAGWLLRRPKTEDRRPATIREGREEREEGSEVRSPQHAVRSTQSGRFSILNAQFSIRSLLAYELLFLGALLFLVWMRSHDLGFVGPNPWGTERPMDLAFFNAIQHSANFPPSDPWLSGFSINYYYFGYMLMAAMALLSGVTGGAGYNLSLALIFALTALGVAGVILNLIRLYEAKNREPRTQNQTDALDVDDAPHGQPTTLRPVLGSLRLRSGQARFSVLGSWATVLLALVFVLFAANQFGALQVLVGSERVVALDGGQLGAAVGQALGDAPFITLPSPVNTLPPPWEWGSFQTLERSDRVNDFNWWWPSRALWDEYPELDPETPATTIRRYTITEFPFFSFWLGDMHPHVMSLPFGLLALALALNTLARPAAPTFTLNRAGWLELLLTGLVLGSLYTINSWDLPTYMLLYAGALALLYWRFAEGRFENLLWQPLLQQLAMVALAAFVLFAPFHLTFRSFAGGAAATSLPIIGGLTRMIGIYTGARSGLHAFLIIFGLFLLPLLAFVYMLRRQLPQTDSPASSQALGLIARPRSSALDFRSFATVLPLLPPVLLVVGLLVGFPLLGLLGLGLLAVWLAMRLVNRPVESFGLLVVVLGCAIAFGTELIFIRDTFGNRMNTIFKFYYQLWLLWGVLAAFGVWWLVQQTGDGRPETGAAQRRRKRVSISSVFSFAALGLTALLLVGALVYPALVLRQMTTQGQWAGIDGRTPRERTLAGENAIAWLRQNAPHGSVVLEAVGEGGGFAYDTGGDGYGGVSASSGIPTVLGWPGHQSQWRNGDAATLAQLEVRQADVDTIYSTLDVNQARNLLQQYNVSYVYVGELERRRYAPESLAKFAQLGNIVFNQDEVTIYKISP